MADGLSCRTAAVSRVCTIAIVRDVGVTFAHTTLDFHGAAYGVNNARELDEYAVTGALDDLPMVLADLRTD
jgi:hypothetical protein